MCRVSATLPRPWGQRTRVPTQQLLNGVPLVFPLPLKLKTHLTSLLGSWVTLVPKLLT